MRAWAAEECVRSPTRLRTGEATVKENGRGPSKTFHYKNPPIIKIH